MLTDKAVEFLRISSALIVAIEFVLVAAGAEGKDVRVSLRQPRLSDAAATPITRSKNPERRTGMGGGDKVCDKVYDKGSC
jgi:hypothetical protein